MKRKVLSVVTTVAGFAAIIALIAVFFGARGGGSRHGFAASRVDDFGNMLIVKEDAYVLSDGSAVDVWRIAGQNPYSLERRYYFSDERVYALKSGEILLDVAGESHYESFPPKFRELDESAAERIKDGLEILNIESELEKARAELDEAMRDEREFHYKILTQSVHIDGAGILVQVNASVKLYVQRGMYVEGRRGATPARQVWIYNEDAFYRADYDLTFDAKTGELIEQSWKLYDADGSMIDEGGSAE